MTTKDEEERNQKLVKAVLDWWQEHRCDTTQNGEDEFNVYDEEPEFVNIAQTIMEEKEQENVLNEYLKKVK